MLKLRIEGKEADIQKFLDHIHVDEGVEINSISTLYPNRKSVYFRCYIEIELNEEEGEEYGQSYLYK